MTEPNAISALRARRATLEDQRNTTIEHRTRSQFNVNQFQRQIDDCTAEIESIDAALELLEAQEGQA